MKMDILSKMVMIYRRHHSNGNPIQIETPRLEYITETFDFHSNNQKIFTGDDN